MNVIFISQPAVRSLIHFLVYPRLLRFRLLQLPFFATTQPYSIITLSLHVCKNERKPKSCFLCCSFSLRFPLLLRTHHHPVSRNANRLLPSFLRILFFPFFFSRNRTPRRNYLQRILPFHILSRLLHLPQAQRTPRLEPIRRLERHAVVARRVVRIVRVG